MKGSGPNLIKLVAAPSDDSIASGRRPGRICYVDDSRTSAYVTKKILTEFGYHVDHFNTAEPAIVALLENDYDLLLTDLLLSTGGMNGDDLVRFLRMSGHPKKKLLPVIVITGSSDKDTLLRIYEAGANGVLVKPITGDELNERIRGLIPDHRLAPSHSGYALEIHGEPGNPAGPAPAGRKPPALANAPAGQKAPPSAHKVPAPPMTPRASGPAHKPSVLANEKQNRVSGVTAQAAPETPPVKARPITAFGAKKRAQPAASDSARDAASVIAELRASDQQDEDIPTLTLSLEDPLIEEPASRRPADDIQLIPKSKEGRVPKTSAEHNTATLFDASGVAGAIAKRPGRERAAMPEAPPRSIVDAAAMHASVAKEPRERTPAREPEESFPSDAKAIVTALDIEQDFPAFKDDALQPSMTHTVIETVKRYKVLSASALASLLIIGWSALNFMSKGNVINVETVHAQTGSLHQAITVPGKVVSKLKVDVSPSAGGQVKQVFVKEGDKVRKGQNIAQLENDEVSNEVKRAEGNLQTTREETAMAEKTVTRMRRALDLGAVSRQAVEEAEMALKSVKAKETAARDQVRSTRQLLDKLMITAPFEGTITSRQIQVGQYVRPSEPIVSIVDLGQREIETKVDAADSSAINTGQEVDVSTDAFPGRKWRELVTRVAPSANRESMANTVNVYISLGKEAPPLKVGQQVDADIRIVSADQAIKLPIGALIQRNGKIWVAVSEEGRVHYLPVTTGMEDLTHAEITQGIRSGQEVILPKGAVLNEGDRVNTVASH